MSRSFSASLLAAVLLGHALAVETPHNPYKDGYATGVMHYGGSQWLKVRGTQSKAWMNYALAGGLLSGMSAARLLVYVKEVRQPGMLRVGLAANLGYPEDGTPYEALQTVSDSAVGSVALRSEDTQECVNIPLTPAFMESLRAGRFDGFVLWGDQGLDAELGALEGARGAVLFLDYAPGGARESIPPRALEGPEAVRSMHLPIGGWNMDAEEGKSLDLGVHAHRIRGLSALIRRDGASGDPDPAAVELLPLEDAGSLRVKGSVLFLTRREGAAFDGPDFDDGRRNRGWVRVEYVE